MVNILKWKAVLVHRPNKIPDENIIDLIDELHIIGELSEVSLSDKDCPK